MRIEIASEAIGLHYLPQLKDMLMRTVNEGASMGWLPPLHEEVAERWWCDRLAEISAGGRVVLVAFDGDALVGSAQLALEKRENGTHRAEVQKVMVHPDFRQRGIGRQLMLALEDYAIHARRTLLFLDTREGDPAEALYAGLGYQRVGVIPEYARNPDGSLVGTVIYSKILRP